MSGSQWIKDIHFLLFFWNGWCSTKIYFRHIFKFFLGNFWDLLFYDLSSYILYYLWKICFAWILLHKFSHSLVSRYFSEQQYLLHFFSSHWSQFFLFSLWFICSHRVKNLLKSGQPLACISFVPQCLRSFLPFPAMFLLTISDQCWACNASTLNGISSFKIGSALFFLLISGQLALAFTCSGTRSSSVLCFLKPGSSSSDPNCLLCKLDQ